MTTPTELSTPEFNAHGLAGKLEWLAKDIRGKAHGGDLTPDYVADQLAIMQAALPAASDIVLVPIEGKSVELPVVCDDPVAARLTLQAERGAQEIERREQPRWSNWRRLIGR